MKMDFILSTTYEEAMKNALLDLLDKSQQDVFGSYIVIVPEQKTMQVERFLLENSKNKAFANIYVYSFNRLLKRIQTKPIYPLNKEAGVMIVRNLIMALSGDLVCYKKTAGTVGFAENIYETLQQLKSSNISPIELSESAKKCSTALRIKLEDIALIYDAYENYLGEELIDSSDKLIMLEKQIGTSEKVRNSHVYIVGFDALTANADQVIKSLVKNAKSVTVSASYFSKDKKNAHIADNEVFEHLKKIADSLKIPYNPKFEEKQLSGDFKHIYENLYSYPVKKCKSQGNIKLFGAPNFDIEAKKVASLIKKDILLNKCRYKDNAVFLASEEAKDSIINAFKEYEIPCFSTSPYEYENHQLFVFIKLLFAMLRKNMEAEDVIKFSKCALLNLDDNLTDDFENYVLKYGINHNKFLKPFAYKDIDERRINSELVRNNIYDIVNSFALIYNENMTVKEVVESLFEFFKNIEIEKRLDLLFNNQEKLNQTRDSYATKQAFTKAKEVLEMLAQFLGNEKIKLDEFYTLLISGLEAADITLLPLSVDCVQVVSDPDSLLEIKNLYVVGASDGTFPRREQDLGLIQDSEIVSLEVLNEKKIEPTIKTINRRERYKIFELLQLPTNNLIISFSEHAKAGEEVKMTSLMQSVAGLFVDDEGNELAIEKVFSAYSENPEKENSEIDLIRSLGTKANALKYLAENVSGYKYGGSYLMGSRVIHSLYKALENDMDIQTKNSFNEINLNKEFSKINNAKNLYFPKNTTSISQLERYFTCPFMHFANYGLKLKDREKADMKALDVGDILHEVSEKFVLFASKKPDVNVDKFAINTLKNILSKEKYSEEDNRVLIHILEAEAIRLCRALKDEMDSSSFRITAAEKWFGKNGDYKGILLNEKENIELVGKIDRIDETEDFYRIIDYKTGKIETKPEDIYYGKKLQLALYLSAIQNVKKQPAGVLYFPIRNEFADSKKKAKEVYRMKGYLLNNKEAILKMDRSLNKDNPRSRFITPEIKTSSEEVEFKANNSLLSSEEMKTMAAYARDVASKATEEILSGYCKPAPYKSGAGMACDYCEFKKVCGIMSVDYQTARESKNAKAKEFYKEGTIWQKK